MAESTVDFVPKPIPSRVDAGAKSVVELRSLCAQVCPYAIVERKKVLVGKDVGHWAPLVVFTRLRL